VTGAAVPRLALVAHDVHDDGGMERVVAQLVRHLQEHFAIVVVSSTLAGDLRGLVRWERVRVPRAPFPLKFVTFFVRAGWRLRRLDVDLVQTVGAIVPNRVDVAAVHFCHADYRAATGSLAPDDAPGIRRLNSTVARALAVLAERWCYRPSRLRVFSAVSCGVGEATARHYPGVQVAVVPNGVDLGRFQADAMVRAEMRRELSDDAVVALFVGGDWDRKGLGVAVEAMGILRRRGRPVHLWVVGDGDMGRYREEATRLGVVDTVSFFGRRTDTERWFQAADVLLLPSLYEAFPLVALEAASCGLPVVATPVHGIAELVGRDEAGVLVERRPDALADAIGRLALDPGLRRHLGEEARRRVQSLTWERCAELTRQLLYELTHPSTRTPASLPSVSVVVPTWRRPESLRNCLVAIAELEDPPFEVIVTRRDEDAAASAVVESSPVPGIREVTVDEPGVIAALRAGSAVARGEVVAFLDDDTVPRPDWLRRLASHYTDPQVGAVGGRDIVHENGGILTGRAGPVGVVTPWGRAIGGHHLGEGQPRLADHLKGANMSVRRSLLALPEGLRGAGAQVAWELATSLKVAAAGSLIVYDPTAAVDHFPAERFDEDGRQRRSTSAIEDAAYNQSYVVMSLRPELRRRRLVHQLAVGERWSPGVVRAAVALAAGEREVLRSVAPAVRAQVRAFRDSRRRPLATTPPRAS
jgi:glycosyltransferase involved in cell wall biosynthesis